MTVLWTVIGTWNAVGLTPVAALRRWRRSAQGSWRLRAVDPWTALCDDVGT